MHYVFLAASLLITGAVVVFAVAVFVVMCRAAFSRKPRV